MELFVTRILKFLLYTFNSVILVYGIFLIVCGTMIVNDMKSFNNFLESKILWLPYFITFNGILMVILALLGYWGTYRQNYKLLFIISAVIVLLIEMALITWMSSGDPRFSEQLRDSLRKSMNNFVTSDLDKKSWHYLQKSIKCCGIERPEDWGRFHAKGQAPSSCCINNSESPQTLCRIIDPKAYHTVGCHSVLFKRISDHWSVVSLLAAVAAFVQVIVLLLSVFMASIVKRAKSARERQ